MSSFTAEQARICLAGEVAGALLKAQHNGDLLDPIEDVVLSKDDAGVYNPWLRVITKGGHELVVSVVALSTDAEPA